MKICNLILGTAVFWAGSMADINAAPVPKPKPPKPDDTITKDEANELCERMNKVVDPSKEPIGTVSTCSLNTPGITLIVETTIDVVTVNFNNNRIVPGNLQATGFEIVAAGKNGKKSKVKFNCAYEPKAQCNLSSAWGNKVMKEGAYCFDVADEENNIFAYYKGYQKMCGHTKQFSVVDGDDDYNAKDFIFTSDEVLVDLPQLGKGLTDEEYEKAKQEFLLANSKSCMKVFRATKEAEYMKHALIQKWQKECEKAENKTKKQKCTFCMEDPNAPAVPVIPQVMPGPKEKIIF